MATKKELDFAVEILVKLVLANGWTIPNWSGKMIEGAPVRDAVRELIEGALDAED